MVRRLAVALCFVAAPAFAQPVTMVYQGTLNGLGGDPVTSNVSMTFKIFDAATAGSQLWTETVNADVQNGYFTVVLGQTQALVESLFPSNADRFLSVTIGGDELTPRQALGSVPWALVCGDAQTVGGIAPADLGDITGVTSPNGTLTGGGLSGNLTLDVNFAAMGSCADPTNDKVVGVDAATGVVQCQPDLQAPAGAGDITSVSPGFSGTLTGGGLSGDVTLDLAVPVSAQNGGTGLFGSTDPFASTYLRSDSFGGWFESQPDGNNIIPGTIDFSKWNNAAGCLAGQVPEFDGFNWVCGNVVSGVRSSGLTCGTIGASDTTMQTVGVTFPSNGYAMIVSEAEWDAVNANEYLGCHVNEDGVAYEFWDWDSGDTEGWYDLMQTHHTAKAVTAGLHTYDLVCFHQGPADDNFCSGQVTVAFFPNTL
jgi:hypothetical protein